MHSLTNRIAENATYIRRIIEEKLYDKAHQQVHPPIASQLREIYTIDSTAQQVNFLTSMFKLNLKFTFPNFHYKNMQTKPFWIKAEIRIRNTNSRYYFLSCPNPTCMKPTGADIDTDFTCFYCRMTYPKPLARYRL